MKKRLLPFILAGALTAAFAAPAAAQTNDCNITIPSQGGAAGLAALVAAAVNVTGGVGICNVDVDLLNNSLNNLLRNANIEVLNNSLNNNRILQDIQIIRDVTVSGNVITVDVLSGPDFIINLV